MASKIAPAVSSFDVDPNRVDPEKAQSLLKKMLNVYRQRVEDSKKLAG